MGPSAAPGAMNRGHFAKIVEWRGGGFIESPEELSVAFGCSRWVTRKMEIRIWVHGPLAFVHELLIDQANHHKTKLLGNILPRHRITSRSAIDMRFYGTIVRWWDRCHHFIQSILAQAGNRSNRNILDYVERMVPVEFTVLPWE
jgi:hypothetical protein